MRYILETRNTLDLFQKRIGMGHDYCQYVVDSCKRKVFILNGLMQLLAISVLFVLLFDAHILPHDTSLVSFAVGFGQEGKRGVCCLGNFQFVDGTADKTEYFYI